MAPSTWSAFSPCCRTSFPEGRSEGSTARIPGRHAGAIAQLGEHLHGMQAGVSAVPASVQVRLIGHS